MTVDVLGDLNWLAVVAAGVAYFALGGIWYAERVFGKAWMRAMDWDPPADYKPSPSMYIVPAITCLISAVVVGAIAAATATDTLAEGIVLGIMVGIVAFAVVFVTFFFDPKQKTPMTSAAISGGYHVVGLLIVSIIVALWQ